MIATAHKPTVVVASCVIPRRVPAADCQQLAIAIALESGLRLTGEIAISATAPMPTLEQLGAWLDAVPNAWEVVTR